MREKFADYLKGIHLFKGVQSFDLSDIQNNIFSNSSKKLQN